MTTRQWSGAAVAWLVLVAVLLRAADGERPVVGTVAAVGVVLLVANARALTRRRPAPLIDRASAPAEVLLGSSMVAFAVASAFDKLAVSIGLLVVALMSAVWIAMSLSSERRRR